ncbi:MULTISPECIES: hypothetical protein [unclassified Pseudomonas]|uniref:hypothetical protein n=1 Tax=unclassified Pseudomonas TaxID=196821 RepID=UPI001B340025|nr:MULTISPECIES: hypothetical protein [unclassified Pseudomonas]MBP5948534.1 hypothetical protein [Pseudomonas sp. P9(2020)]MBZ9560738.1 hypothetical protein [Pseudomonas sp. P116]
MKYKISKAEYEALDAAMQALYKAMGDDFVLFVEGLPTGSDDLEGLRNQVQTLLTEKKEEKRKRDAAEAEQRRLQEESQRANGEYEQLYTSSQQALEQERTRLAELTQSIERRDLTSAASKVSSSIADGENAEILAEFVQRRLKIVDGQVKVTDAAGNLTIASLEDLAKEFQQAPRYASLVRGTKANGGGATGGSGGGATKQLHEMSDAERIQLSNENPTLFNQMVQQAKSKE